MADKFALARQARDDRIRVSERLKTKDDALRMVLGYINGVAIPHEIMDPPPAMSGDGGSPSGPQTGAEAAQVAEAGLSA
jgi:hypothetical protein